MLLLGIENDVSEKSNLKNRRTTNEALAIASREANRIMLSKIEKEKANELLKAVVLERLPQVEAILSENTWLAEQARTNEYKFLQQACYTNNLELVKLLLNRGFTPNPPLELGGNSPLTVAIAEQAWDIFRALLSKGADPNGDRTLITAINIECEDDSLPYVKLLIEHGCELNRIFEVYGDKDNCFTALDWAKEKPRIAAFIRSKGGSSIMELP